MLKNGKKATKLPIIVFKIFYTLEKTVKIKIDAATLAADRSLVR
jgi:hypothetical protein